MSLRPRLALALAGLLLPVSSTAQEPPSAGPSLDGHVARIDSALVAAARRGMNGVVHLRTGDEILLHRAYGWRDREAAEAMTTGVAFDIGSLVKPITAVAVLRAEEEGHLRTEQTVGEYFKDAPEDTRDITIDQLLRHRAGLRDYIGGDYELVRRAEALERILSAPLRHPPGEARAYSNAGYTLLAIILEEATGRPYEAWVRGAVLEPAGVPELGYVLPPRSAADVAVGYGPDGERWGTPVRKPWLEDGVSWTFRGAGGMIGTAAETARWYRALLAGEVLGPDALERYLDLGAETAPGGEDVWLAHAGGNGVFNTVHASWVGSDVHFTLFTSTARPLNAETVLEGIVEDVFAVAEGVGPGPDDRRQ